jgi:hypothetical protein
VPHIKQLTITVSTEQACTLIDAARKLGMTPPLEVFVGEVS